MRTKSLLALTILCLALGACATSNTVADDPNVANAEDHANQASTAARADDVSYSTLTPNTEQKTVVTGTTAPEWQSNVNYPTDSTATQSAGSTTTVTGTGTMASGSTMTDNTATTSVTSTTDTTSMTPDTTSTSTLSTSTSNSGSMTSASSVDDDTTTATTETRTRLRKD